MWGKTCRGPIRGSGYRERNAVDVRAGPQLHDDTYEEEGASDRRLKYAVHGTGDPQKFIRGADFEHKLAPSRHGSHTES
jgi:hypothetical protein